MEFEFEKFSENIRAEWDEFVENSKFGSVHQMSDWANFQKKIPGRDDVSGFLVRKDRKIVATTFCVRMDTGFFGKKWWYSARGPVFDPEFDLQAGEFLIQKTSQILKKTGAIFWRFDPYFSEKIRLPNTSVATQNYQPTNTLEIDLKKSDTQILAEMKRKGRYNIGLAQKKGVKIVAISGADVKNQDLEDFCKLNDETTSRDGFFGHEKLYYKNFLHELSKFTVLFFAEFEGRRIATAISTFCGTKAIYYFGASASDKKFRNLMAPYLLQWEMMKFAKSRGCESYDFLGIAPKNSKKHPYAGISEFKFKFGGERREFSAGKEVVFDEFWHFCYMAGKLFKKISKLKSFLRLNFKF